MENEIKDDEYIRTDIGKIDKVINANYYMPQYIECEKNLIFKKDIVKHSPNLIDLIECGDYVNGYIVRRTYLDGETHYIKLGEQITGNRTYTDDIKSIVTKEMMESISYKVTKM